MTATQPRMARGLVFSLVAAAGLIANCSLVNSVDEPLPILPVVGGAAPGGASQGGGGQGGASQAGGGQGGAAGSEGGAAGSGGAAAHCGDGETNESETDVDCGGGECPPCVNGLGCLLPSDCQSQFCEDQEPRPLCAPCVDDQSCAAAVDTYCEAEVCVPQKAPGEVCVGANECLSDFCVDGVCCDTACDGSCDACDVPDYVGTCTELAAGDPGEPPCAPYLCDGVLGTCPDSCTGPGNCTTEAFCQGGECLGQKDPGVACVNDGECLSQHCVDDVCCTVASCGSTGDCNICQPGTGTCGNAPEDRACEDGLYCNGPDECDAAGSCVPTAVDPCAARIGDGDANCAEACDENTDSCIAAEPDTTPCNDTVYCNGADVCVLGACTSHAGDPCAGNVGDADDDCAESCSETADSCTANDPNGSACADGTYCNGTDTCSNGSCAVHGGDPCPGPDADANCAESCNEAGDNCTASDPNGAACSDGSYCNGTDTCTAGACTVHTGDPCPGPDGDASCVESCNETNDSCTANDPNGAACSDGTYCNGTETCTNGACGGSAGDPCGPASDANCAACNETSDNCTASEPNGSACSDGAYCNGTETCSGGACAGSTGDPCGPVSDANCAGCSETADDCSGVEPNGSACSDSTYCNGTETCTGGACGSSSGDPCGPVSDANCAACNETSDNCTATEPNGSACSDGTYCNGTETCTGGACGSSSGDPCGPASDANCAACNETSDNCSASEPNGSACSDGAYCNGTETCSGGACAGSTGDPCGPVSDANCAACNETSDNCTASEPNGSACNDSLYCNGSDTCSGGACTVHGTNPCPGADGDSDCSETCYEAGDNCTANDPNGTTCGTYQTCQTGTCTGCLNGGLVPPSACTAGTDPGTGSPWVVCTSSCSEAWLSANNAGTFHAALICQNLGYNTASQCGGTWGSVCGSNQPSSCSSPGTPTFNITCDNCGSDSLGPLACSTIQWRCTM